MQTYDAEKAEADAMDFGTLVHSALEASMALTPGMSRKFSWLSKSKLKRTSLKYGGKPFLLQQAAIETDAMRCSWALEISMVGKFRIEKVSFGSPPIQRWFRMVVSLER